jgi:Exostosin family
VRSRELVTGVVSHPFFDPADWGALNRRINEATSLRGVSEDRHSHTPRHYVFLDVETCPSSNYPVYGGGKAQNLDTVGGRVANNNSSSNSSHNNSKSSTMRCLVAARCPYISRVLQSPLFRAYPNHTKLLYFDCRGNSMPWNRRQKLLSNRFAIMSYSAATHQHDATVDQGLAPPAVTTVVLTAGEKRDIARCAAEANRPYLFSFVGSVRNKGRGELVKLHDMSQGIVSLPLFRYRMELASGGGGTNVSFTDLLRQSVFAAAPAGDNRFSYRFTEVLSAGAIPVVHSDMWVLPFRPELVNWSECLLHLPESTIPHTIGILRNVSAERRCQMRQHCREIYTAYMLDGIGTIRGIVDGMELVWAGANNATGPVGAAHRPLLSSGGRPRLGYT